MSTAFHDRFAAELRAILPEGFTVTADQWLIQARYADGASLLGWPPIVADKRKPITRTQALEWIKDTASKERFSLSVYTTEARAAAEAMLATLDSLTEGQNA